MLFTLIKRFIEAVLLVLCLFMSGMLGAAAEAASLDYTDALFTCKKGCRPKTRRQPLSLFILKPHQWHHCGAQPLPDHHF